MTKPSPSEIVLGMRASLTYYDYLLPGDWVPNPPLCKRWFGWRPAFVVTDGMVRWAGEIARARVLMDLKSVATALGEHSGTLPDPRFNEELPSSKGIPSYD